MANFSEIVNVINDRLIEFRDNFTRTIYPLLRTALIKYQEAINSETFQQGVSALKELFEAVSRYGTVHERFCVLAIKLGWLPHPMVFPAGVIEVMEEYEASGEEGARTKLDSYYIERCSEKVLNEMLYAWEQKPLLHRRMPILKQGLGAHIEGKYFIALPAFLAQIEGVIVDGYVHRGELYSPMRKKLLEKALSNRNRFSFDEAIFNIIALKVFGNFKHGETPDFEINRNAILHGANADYGTHINSLKCILMFDYLQSKVGYVTFAGSKRHHKVTCSVVTRYLKKNPHAIVEPYTYDGEYKEACRLCRPDMPIY